MEEEKVLRRGGPKCLSCGRVLPRRIDTTGLHHPTCPWNYYVECPHCGYQNNLAKLLGYWAGCSEECKKGGEGGVDEKTLWKMERYGGSFVQQLSILYRLADFRNKSRLEKCFRDYFEEYRKFPSRGEEDEV